MTPDRWHAIEQVFHAALTRTPDERPAFLAQACGDDRSLRDEVESLLAHSEAPSHLFDGEADPRLRAAILAKLPAAPSPAGHLTGQTLGAYELRTWLASGGMGDVYQAFDTRLNRTVVVKLLPPDPSPDPHDQPRFHREAELIASLNHPHICTIHDVGVHEGRDYLVMEFVDGETLQQRLTRGPVPLAQALTYAIQIADALDKAHRRGIVHRDLKPGNVMIAATGIKLLDFGIATRHADEPARGGGGGVLATPGYASPEQLRGQRVDARSDLFSFGATAYEMITGHRAFPGDTPARAIDNTLGGEPLPIRDLVPAVSDTMARTLERCIAKDPDERWQTASDLLFALRMSTIASETPSPTPPRRSAWIERSLWIAAIAAASLLIWMLRAATLPAPGSPASNEIPDVRVDIWPEPGTAFASSFDVPFALSPDGRRLAYVAIGADGIKRLWLRRFDGAGERPQEIPGIEGAYAPFWSPDGEWIGIFSPPGLMKVRVSNARLQLIAPHASTMAGATWSTTGTILFPAGPGGLSRVSADGGPISPVTTGDGSHFWPQFLGDGEHFLYAAALTREIRVGSLSGRDARVLMQVPVRISSIAFARGYLFYGQDTSLFARAFDESTRTFTGDPIELVKDVPITGLGRTPFSVSAAGPLVVWRYPGGTLASVRRFSETGESQSMIEAPARYVGLAMAPDGRRLAFSRRNPDGGADVWVRDLNTTAETQVTFSGSGVGPRWSSDGRRLAYTAPGRAPLPTLFATAEDHLATSSRIGTATLPTFASSWSHDGKVIVSVRIDPATRTDLHSESTDGARRERLSINSDGNDYLGVLSPDDRWLAFVTDVSGRDEVWVASFPSGAIRHQVSIDGGTSPQWTAGGREIAYVSSRRKLAVRSFTVTTAGSSLGPPRDLFDASAFIETTPLVTPSANAYTAAAEGHDFVAAVRVNDPKTPPIQLVLNWRALLSR
jgi:serine/threonine protein kinase/Tol biopolymer transport system component